MFRVKTHKKVCLSAFICNKTICKFSGSNLFKQQNNATKIINSICQAKDHLSVVHQQFPSLLLPRSSVDIYLILFKITTDSYFTHKQCLICQSSPKWSTTWDKRLTCTYHNFWPRRRNFFMNNDPCVIPAESAISIWLKLNLGQFQSRRQIKPLWWRHHAQQCIQKFPVWLSYFVCFCWTRSKVIFLFS